MIQKIDYDYVGWVPCLNGQLVFDLVECGLQYDEDKSVSIVHHELDNCGNISEYVFLHSIVNWKDFGGESVHGLWSVILFSKLNKLKNNHTGAVYFVLNDNKNKKIDIFLENIKETRYELMSNENYQGFSDKICNLIQNLDDIPNVDFILDGDGIVWLKATDNKIYDADIISRQAYYYIKYSWHKHRHHDSRSETLTTAYKFDEHNDNYRIYIANEFIGNLKRNLVFLKRDIDNNSYKNITKIKGIICYTKSVIEIMRARKFIDDDLYNKELKHLEYFEGSLDIISSGIDKDIAIYNVAINNIRAIILFVFAVIISPALIVNRDAIKNSLSSDNVPNYVLWIISWYTNTNSFIFLIISIVAIFLLYRFIYFNFGTTGIFFNMVKKSVSLIVGDKYPNNTLSNSNVLITVIIMLLSIFLFYEMFTIKEYISSHDINFIKIIHNFNY